MKISSTIQLIRPLNAAITFISTVVAILISQEAVLSISIYLLAALSSSLTAAAGNIINDYYDIETDKINKPNRPLVTGRVTKPQAIGLYISLNIIALFVSYFINLTALSIVLLAEALLFYYSFKLKRIPFVGNIAVSLLTGLVFIYGGAAAGNVQNAIVPALFAFLINLIRELVKDIEDIKGDSLAGIRTLPIIKGINYCKWIIFSLTLLLILITFHPFIFSYYRIEFFIVVMVVVNPVLVYFLTSFFRDQSLQNLNKLSTLLKINMMFGLIAIYMGR